MNFMTVEVRNLLPEELVDELAEYWCDKHREENLGQFIQRVAECAVRLEEDKHIICPDCNQPFKMRLGKE